VPGHDGHHDGGLFEVVDVDGIRHDGGEILAYALP
jgi:hypothetical protein